MSAADSARSHPEHLFRCALRAVDARVRTERAVQRLPRDLPWVVLAAGKAAAAQAAALEAAAGDHSLRGMAVTKDGHGEPLSRISLREAAHPVPDERCEAAGRAALELVAGIRPDERLIVLLSGGASALLTSPVPGVGQSDLATTTQLLLAAGADIFELNTVRKHLSLVGGGQLARAAGTKHIELLAISDVPGDHLDVIGSGPVTGDPSLFEDALAILDRLALGDAVPAAVRSHLLSGAQGEYAETPKPGDDCFSHVHSQVLASNADALQAARDAAEHKGMLAHVAAGALAGQARELAPQLLERARTKQAAHPCVLIAGGESTVQVTGSGRGGRNLELALAAALAMQGQSDVALLAAGTDGSDGPTDAAGAFADGGSVSRALAQGLDAQAALDANDSYTFWDREGGILRTGPTGTNVMDLAFVWLDRAPALTS